MRSVSTQPSTADPVLPEVKMNLVPANSPVEGTVVSNHMCLKGKSNAFVRHTEIDVSGTPLAGNFLPGQSFGVIAPGEDEKGKPHKVRLYSIACASWGEDGEANVISTTPKRLLDERSPQKKDDDAEDHSLFVGVCSNYLCDLRPGDKVKVTGPAGKRFILPASPDDHDYLFLAAGTGIAPFRGFALELLRNPKGASSSRIELVMGSPYTSDLLYDDLFRELESEHEKFTYKTAISREPRPGSARGVYMDKMMDEQFDHYRDLLANPRTLIYVCGLIGMQYGLYQLLAKHGLADGYITIKDDLAGVDPSEWTYDLMKRNVRPTHRAMIEVY